MMSGVAQRAPVYSVTRRPGRRLWSSWTTRLEIWFEKPYIFLVSYIPSRNSLNKKKRRDAEKVLPGS